jgi:23S rRNA (cytosine1962-C5)-methyltransferase
MKRLYLKRKISNRVANGHPWVFANEVQKVDEGTDAGNIVEVYLENLLARDILIQNPR